MKSLKVGVVFLWISAFLSIYPGLQAWGEVQKDLAEDQIHTQKVILDNGLTVLVSEMPSSSVVAVYALVKAGSATEGRLMGSGISHFLEHMLFKGTKKRGVGEISREVQSLGGTINASTSFDYTIYTITVPFTEFDKALDILADMIMNSQFDAQQIQREREVVYGEIRLYQDRPERQLSDMTFGLVYKRHPYGIPIIGYEELLARLNREDFVEYYRTHYVPNNTIVTIAGQVKADEVLPKVKAAFKDFERKPYPLRHIPQEPEQISERYYEDYYPTELTRVSMAYAGISILDSDVYALDVLAMILGQGETSRLYKDLFRDKQLVKSVSSSNFTPVDRGVFEVEVTLDQSHLEETIQAIKGHIAAIRENGVNPDELEKAKRQVLSSHIFGRQTAQPIASSAAIDEAFTGDHHFSKKYVQEVRAVTLEDIQRVAREYLQDHRLSTAVLYPESERKIATSAPAASQAKDIEKIVLNNGLTLLLREDHTFPLVAFNLVLEGGIGQESQALNGISYLTAQLWTKGTSTLTAEQISDLVEKRGAGLSSFSGRNSFGLALSVLAEDLDFGIDLLSDLIKNPAFDNGELLKEKEKVLTAIVARDDNIGRVAHHFLREILFQSPAFRLEELGTKESVQAITAKDVSDCYRRFASPDNMVLSVFGDFDPNSVKEKLSTHLSSLAKLDVQINRAKEPPLTSKLEKTSFMNKKQVAVLLGFHGASLYHQDRYGLEVMASLLGSPFSGRIFTKIRDQLGLSYTLGGGYVPGLDTGLISFYVLTSEDKVNEVKNALEELIKDIREKPVDEQELKNIKSYLKGTFQMGLETNASLGFLTAMDELYQLGFHNYQKHNENIDKITSKDILKLAKEYLNLEKSALVIVRPQPKETSKP
jgi:zinc protease